MPLRKSQFFYDNAAETLTDYSTDINSVAGDLGQEVLDDTGLNEDWLSRFPGIRDGQIALSGYCTQLNTGIMKSLLEAEGTSVTKTFQWKIGTRYLNGETYPSTLKIGDVDGKKIIPFSVTLLVDGAVNETSVAL